MRQSGLHVDRHVARDSALIGRHPALLIRTDIVTLVPRRPRTAVTKSATILGLYLAAALAAIAVAFVQLSYSASHAVVAVLFVAAFVVGQQLVRYEGWVQIVGALAAAVFVFCTFVATPVTVLTWHGDTVPAKIVDVSMHHTSRRTEYVYGLADSGSHRIAGDLTETYLAYNLGDSVTVVVDRDNWVAPETIDDVESERPLWIAVLIGLVIVVAVSIRGGLVSGDGPLPEKGPLGLWMLTRRG
jgi:hypothetical protein